MSLFYQIFDNLKRKGGLIKRLFISGYRSYELGVFSKKDKKLFYIKEFIKQRLRQYADRGLEWVIISGQLGVELWSGEAIIELSEELPELKLAVLLPFKGFGENWNEENTFLYQKIIDAADFVTYTSHQEYQHGGQLSGNAQFIMDNTDGLFLIYDPEKEGKPSFLYNQAKTFAEKTDYPIDIADFDELQEFVIDFQEINNVM